jgi:hypothetical protein
LVDWLLSVAHHLPTWSARTEQNRAAESITSFGSPAIRQRIQSFPQRRAALRLYREDLLIYRLYLSF